VAIKILSWVLSSCVRFWLFKSRKKRQIKYRVFASEFKLIETVGVTSFVSRKQTNTRHCSRNNGQQLEKSQLIWKLIINNYSLIFACTSFLSRLNYGEMVVFKRKLEWRRFIGLVIMWMFMLFIIFWLAKRSKPKCVR
jgi:hypothetical protein